MCSHTFKARKMFSHFPSLSRRLILHSQQQPRAEEEQKTSTFERVLLQDYKVTCHLLYPYLDFRTLITALQPVCHAANNTINQSFLIAKEIDGLEVAKRYILTLPNLPTIKLVLIHRAKHRDRMLEVYKTMHEGALEWQIRVAKRREETRILQGYNKYDARLRTELHGTINAVGSEIYEVNKYVKAAKGIKIGHSNLMIAHNLTKEMQEAHCFFHYHTCQMLSNCYDDLFKITSELGTIIRNATQWKGQYMWTTQL